MKIKALLFGLLLISMMSMTFAIPTAAQCDKPSWALSATDVPELILFNESCYAMEVPNPMDPTKNLSFSIYWQIWTDNASWLLVNKCIMITGMDYGIDFNEEFMGVTFWDLFASSFIGVMGGEELTGTGLDHCLIWNESGIWFAVGHKGSILVMAGGFNMPYTPEVPLFFSKAPLKADEMAASKEDITTIIKAQGGKFGGGIPAFDFLPIVMSVATLVGIIFLFRKHQLSLVRTA